MTSLALQNLLSPPVLFFLLGVFAAFVRSDLSIPEAVARFLALYLLFSIGFRGGAEVAHHGPTFALLASIGAGIALSFLLPFLAYVLLGAISNLGVADRASIGAHYGSISAVTFVAVTGLLTQLAIPHDGFMVAVAAAMETPAIFAGLLIARSVMGGEAVTAPSDSKRARDGGHLREIFFNGSILILVGAFVIGMLTGSRGMSTMKPFILDSFPGLLCLFMLDMGLVAGRGLKQGWRNLKPALIGFGIVMPLIGCAVAALIGDVIGHQAGSLAVLMTLSASASYIAVPAAMRLALPQANPAISLTLSLGVTFPFNLLVGIPTYIAIAQRLAS
jgi:hypothetical protein